MDNNKASRIYNEYIKQIRNILIKKFGSTNNIDEIVDIAHDALTEAIIKYDKSYTDMNNKGKERAWFYTVCSNYCMDYYKKKSNKIRNKFYTMNDCHDDMLDVSNNDSGYNIENNLHNKMLFNKIDGILSKYLEENEKNKFLDINYKGFTMKQLFKRYDYKTYQNVCTDLKRITNKVKSIKEFKNAELQF